MTRLINRFLLATSLAGLSALACAQVRPLPTTAQTATATPAPSTSGLANIEIRGQLRSERQAILSSEAPGVIKMLLPESTAFEKGQVLAELDCALFLAQRDKSRIEVSAAELQQKAQERLAELEAGSQIDLALSRNSVARLKAELNIIDTQVSKCKVHAPYAGVVAEHMQRPFQYVQTGQAMLVIVDEARFDLEFLVPSTWNRKVNVGDLLFFYADEVRLNIKARVIRTGTRVDPISQSVKVVAELINPPPNLKVGMSGRVALAPAP
jgi:RND family efflux transporter MFP subunit